MTSFIDKPSAHMDARDGVSSINNPNSIAFANIQTNCAQNMQSSVALSLQCVFHRGCTIKHMQPFNTCKRLTWIFFLKVTHPSKWTSRFQHGVHVQKWFPSELSDLLHQMFSLQHSNCDGY